MFDAGSYQEPYELHNGESQDDLSGTKSILQLALVLGLVAIGGYVLFKK